jgi:hypothetical protein
MTASNAWSLENALSKWFNPKKKMEKEIRDYILLVLTEFGQMRHIEGKVVCNEEHKKPGDKTIPYNQNGYMKMDVKIRMDLIDEGWKLIKKNEKLY